MKQYKKLILRLAVASLCMAGPLSFSAHADDMVAKPPTFDACMQADTPATLSQIYNACLQSSNASNLKHYIKDAQFTARATTPAKATRKMYAEAWDAKDIHYYYGALAVMRQTEILLKHEQSQNQKSAKLCYYAKNAGIQSGSYRGSLRGYSFEERKSRANALRKSCKSSPLYSFDASKTVPDTGNLMTDIPEYKTCLTPVTKDNIFDINNACYRAEHKNGMLAFRKASLTSSSFGGSTLASVHIAAAKIKHRQAELANVLEPKNMEYLCNLISRVNYYYGQSGQTPVVGSADDAMLKNAEKMKANCKLRNF